MLYRSIFRIAFSRALFGAALSLSVLGSIGAASAVAGERLEYLKETGEGKEKKCEEKLGFIDWCESPRSALEDAFTKGKDQAVKMIKETCENSMSGKLKAAPTVFRRVCDGENIEDNNQEFSCKVTVHANCAIQTPDSAPANPKVATNAKPKERIRVDQYGTRYRIDAQGRAHEIDPEEEAVKAAAAAQAASQPQPQVISESGPAAMAK